MTNTATPISAVIQKVRQSVRSTGDLRLVGEIMGTPRTTHRGVWIDLADAEGAIEAFVPTARLPEGGLKSGQHLNIYGQPISRAEGCSWYFRPDHVYVINETGPMTAQRQADLKQLQATGVIPADRASGDIFAHATGVDWPARLSKVTVLTADNSAALGDFITKAPKSRDGITITTVAVRVQGNGMAQNIAGELAKIRMIDADLVFIIRGGGSWADLRQFDNPDLARAVRRCPVPVITAIGHKRDASLTDRAAYAAFITPTDAGAALWTPIRERTKPTPDKTKPTSKTNQAETRNQQANELAKEQTRRRHLENDLVACRQQLRTETTNAANRQYEAQQLSQLFREHLIDDASTRVQRRSRTQAILCWLAASAIAYSTLHLPRSAALEILTCAATLVAVGIYFATGPRRSRKPPHQKHFRRLPNTEAEWVARIKQAHTPRKLRLLRFYWRH